MPDLSIEIFIEPQNILVIPVESYISLKIKIKSGVIELRESDQDDKSVRGSNRKPVHRTDNRTEEERK